MREHPILFSGPMVRAILDGRKTQTRRLMRIPVYGPSDGCKRRVLSPEREGDRELLLKCSPYGKPGHRLWVRETWYDDFQNGAQETAGIYYRADGEAHEQFEDLDCFAWRPSIFMPRWASRITLEITNVSVERLHEITEADARAEGVGITAPKLVHGSLASMSARENFAALWHDINGKRAPWESNPWVWVVAFAMLSEPAKALAS